VRWISVLTDAPLTPTGTPMEPRCGKCTACVDACPVHAFTGRLFVPGEQREVRFDAAACDRYFKVMEKDSRPAVCGMCLFVCPHGRKPREKKA
jgi:epoxyqueuosine reductase